MPGDNRSKGIREMLSSMIELRKPSSAKFKLRDIVFFFQFVRPVWKIGAASVILLMITTGISALMPFTSKIFIDFVLMKTGYDGVYAVLGMAGLGGYAPTVVEHLSSLNFVIIAMLIAGIIYGILNILQSYLSSIYQLEMTYNIQARLFDHVLRFPMTYFKSKQTGYLMSRISDDVSVMQNLFSIALVQILSSVFYLIFGVVVLVSINASLMGIIVVIIPVYLIVRELFSSRIRGLSYQQREYHSEVSRDMQETLSGVELVKSYATEKKEVEKVSHKLRDVIQASIALTVVSSLAGLFMSATVFALMLAIMYIGATSIQKGAMTIGDFITVITYLMTLSGAVNTLYRTYLSFQPAFASMDRLKEMFSIAPEFEWEEKGKPLKKLDHVKGGIRFDDVSFAYNVNEAVLKNISFEAKPGEVIALVGHSGVGKTTAVSLMLKLYIPQSGTICLDGIDINELDHAWLRQQISIVSQDIFLFNDTIENNIKYGKPDASREDAVKVAKKAHIHEFIESLPKGYDTIIGERGTKLSVGQRQRISIARAFLKNTPILILDEPTSSIDTETEMHIKESLGDLMKGKTTFIISHRMSLTDIADMIVVIDGGQIVQSGTHKELENKEGLYQTLWSLDRTHAGRPAGLNQ